MDFSGVCFSFPYWTEIKTSFGNLLSTIYSECSFHCCLGFNIVLVITSISNPFLIYSFHILSNNEQHTIFLKILTFTESILFKYFLFVPIFCFHVVMLVLLLPYTFSFLYLLLHYFSTFFGSSKPFSKTTFFSNNYATYET